MKNNYISTGLKGLLFALSLIIAVTNTCLAADVYLVAKEFVATMPDSTNISMWGFARDADQDLLTDGGETASSPGPMIEVASGDPILNIHLRNDLNQPVSIMIPGQSTGMSPVKFTDAQGRSRVRSLTHETAPGSTQIYTWNSLRPGSYVYQSATHPAVQVQMGLYGAFVKDTATGTAYDGITYDNSAVLFHSEIDPALHNAVISGTYGSVDYPSTINYVPKYFLINGAPYPDAMPVFQHKPVPGETLLIRFMSAGLQTHVPTFVGPDMSIVAEDGNRYSYPHEQYAVLLTAGKTVDAVVSGIDKGIYTVYDRSLDLTNAMMANGGMQTRIFVNACTADIDNSGAVNGVDFSILISQWGRVCNGQNPCSGDINGDGTVNGIDYAGLFSQWGTANCLTP